MPAMTTSEATEQLQKAVHQKVNSLRVTHPEYKAQPCACKLWADKPWIFLLVSSPKVLNEARKHQRNEVLLGWYKHMEECK